MAYELRIIAGDTYNVVVTVAGGGGQLVDLVAGNWAVSFESDVINKNSIDNPMDFSIQQDPYTLGQVAISLSCLETANQGSCRKHFAVVLYKPQTPPLRKTVADGTLFFVSEV